MSNGEFDFDVIVVGSGFGGSVTALRLTEKGYRVAVLEAGARFEDDDFSNGTTDIKKYLWAPALGMYGIQRIDAVRDTMIVAGAGVGGGSLVYANTLYEPLPAFYNDPQWSHITDWKSELVALLRPGEADARRGREPGPHARRRRHGEGRGRDGRRRHLPPDPGRRVLRRSRPGGRRDRGRPVLRRRGP